MLSKKYKLLLKVIRHSDDTANKYPKMLDQEKDMNKFFNFEETKFYWINFEKPIKKKNIVLLIIVVFAIVSLCVFPLWPLNFKFAVWWLLMGILVFLVRFLVIFRFL